MDNTARMFSQVAAAAGVPDEKAAIACYLLNLSRAGKSMEDAAALLRMDRATVRDHARSWSIPFHDYPVAREPLTLEWLKPKRGSWELRLDGKLIACADSDGEGGYSAGISGVTGQSFDGSNAHVAIKRASRALEHRSLELLGVDDVVILGPGADGEECQLAPVDIGSRDTLTSALHH